MMETPLSLQLDAFMDRRLEAWTGLPPRASIDEARTLLALPGHADARGFLGTNHLATEQNFVGDRPLALWHRDGHLVLLDDEGPYTPIDLQGLLGSPAATLTTYWGVVTRPEWVYPDRGLSAVLSSTGLVVRLFGFTPMSLDEYTRTVRLDTTPHPVPPSKEILP